MICSFNFQKKKEAASRWRRNWARSGKTSQEEKTFNKNAYEKTFIIKSHKWIVQTVVFLSVASAQLVLFKNWNHNNKTLSISFESKRNYEQQCPISQQMKRLSDEDNEQRFPVKQLDLFFADGFWRIKKANLDHQSMKEFYDLGTNFSFLLCTILFVYDIFIYLDSYKSSNPVV